MTTNENADWEAFEETPEALTPVDTRALRERDAEDWRGLPLAEQFDFQRGKLSAGVVIEAFLETLLDEAELFADLFSAEKIEDWDVPFSERTLSDVLSFPYEELEPYYDKLSEDEEDEEEEEDARAEIRVILTEVILPSDTSAEELRAILTDTDPNAPARIGIAIHPNADEGLLNELSSDPCVSVRRALTARVDCPEEILKKLASDPAEDVRRGVAMNERTPDEILTTLAEDDSFVVRFTVAGNQTAPTSVLANLARDKEILVRLAVAKNNSADDAVLRILVEDPEQAWGVLHAVAESGWGNEPFWDEKAEIDEIDAEILDSLGGAEKIARDLILKEAGVVTVNNGAMNNFLLFVVFYKIFHFLGGIVWSIFFFLWDVAVGLVKVAFGLTVFTVRWLARHLKWWAMDARDAYRAHKANKENKKAEKEEILSTEILAPLRLPVGLENMETGKPVIARPSLFVAEEGDGELLTLEEARAVKALADARAQMEADEAWARQFEALHGEKVGG